uniref:DUF4219 domain-containing protein n=1 Tax=Micrurus lemniscatus lemniscatus TaxID=129467 RepID=A0A2D4H6Y3_MICLE
MAQEQSTSISLINRLDGTNYVSWSMKCNLLLRKDGLWTVVNNPPDVTTWDPLNDEDKKKIAKIGLTLSDQQLVHIRGEESAAKCWDILKKIYVRDSVDAHIHLTCKLFRAHLQQDMLAHLEFMKKTLQQLQEKELIFSEIHQVYIILSSLDETYDDYVSSLEVLTRDELTLTSVTGRLLEESRRKQDRKQLK